MSVQRQTTIIGEVSKGESGLWVRDLFGGGRPIALKAAGLAPDTVVELVIDDSGAVTTRVLADAGSARAKLYALIARYGLSPIYPPEVLAEAEACVANPGIDDPSLRDLSALPFVTIDNEDSRDLDQALYIGDDGAGGNIIYYALADASWYVRPGTALFADALSRGASYYLPGLCVPMLPRPLSEGIVSLNENVDRRALVFEMRVDKAGECVDTKLYRARMRSRAKLAYNGVQRYYDGGEPAIRGSEFQDSLDRLAIVGQQRIARASARNIVRYNRSSVNVSLVDRDGIGFTAVGQPRNACERYNEQISLLTNVAGAKFLRANVHDEELRAVFRVHPAPPQPRFQSLSTAINGLVRQRKLDPKIWGWKWRGKGRETLSDYLERLPEGGEDHGVFLAIQRQALMVNVRSTFSDEPGRHYGVGAPVYSRFSSPMREVVGIFTHKEALEALRGTAGHPDDDEVHDEVIRAANRSKAQQRSLTKAANKLVIDDVLSRTDEDAVRRGTVLGVQNGKLYVELTEPPLEVKIYLRDIAREHRAHYAEDGVVARVKGGSTSFSATIGDQVDFSVDGYDAKRDRWRLVPTALDEAPTDKG